MHTCAAQKLRRFVAINHVIIKMLDASISTYADLMEGERLCTLMGRCEPGPIVDALQRPSADARSEEMANAAN